MHKLRVILVLAILTAWAGPFVRIVPSDFNEFLQPWYDHILASGQVEAFATPFSNYSPPYLYLLSAISLLGLPPLIAIKLLSTVGAVWAAFGVYRLTDRAEAALTFFLIPTTLVNVPLFGQADMFWIAPCLLAIAAAPNTLAVVLWASLAFAFKAQAVFVAPFVAAILIKERAPWWQWLVPLGVYLAAVLPAYLVGWPFSDLMSVYWKQANYMPPNGVRFVSTASNWWALFAIADYDAALRSFTIGFVLAAAATLLFVSWFGRRHLTRSHLLIAAAMSGTMIPFLLPGMHERFFALGEVAAFCWAWASRDRDSIIVAALMQAQLLLAFFGWILHIPLMAVGGGALTTTALWLLLWNCKRPDLAPSRRGGRTGVQQQCRRREAVVGAMDLHPVGALPLVRRVSESDL